MEILSASGNSHNELLLIDSIILSQQTQGLRQRKYPPLLIFITKALCISFGDSDILVLFLVIQGSA